MRLVVVVWMLVQSSSAFAYGSKEHSAIGFESYGRACELLRGRFKDDAQRRARLEALCAHHFMADYSQAVMLSGDYVGSVDEWLTRIPQGVRDANDFMNYLDLALKNETHFHPLSRREWKTYHLHALDLAKPISGKQNGAEAENQFLQAFYVNAFADHFLQDAFAAGHSGFARGKTSPNLAVAFHDRLNRAGRQTRNSRGDVWRMYGDGMYESRENIRGKELLLEAATASVASMLVASVTGEVDPTLESEALQIFPVEALGFSWHCDSDYTDAEMLSPAADCSPEETDQWESIDAVMRPAEAKHDFHLGIASSYRREVTSVLYFADVRANRWARLGVMIGYAHHEADGAAAQLGVRVAVVPIRVERWDSPWIHELALQSDLTFAPIGSTNDTDRNIYGVTASVAYRLSLQIAVNYQYLWVEPAVGVGRFHTEMERNFAVVESHNDTALVGGLTIGWGMLLGVRGGGVVQY